ncbi:hypothetical protein B0H17DRAFT_1092624 [Mycena rosella]|uniref:Uncharacterized protein n=1 Tax=Mycena rosella TaxID=1033263 RepID=A0AAD7CUS8_MYCRO|nr:hypothetical protein B0H17DRAFT_1092624 [Mycena rosella]
MGVALVLLSRLLCPLSYHRRRHRIAANPRNPSFPHGARPPPFPPNARTNAHARTHRVCERTHERTHERRKRTELEMEWKYPGHYSLKSSRHHHHSSFPPFFPPRLAIPIELQITQIQIQIHTTRLHHNFLPLLFPHSCFSPIPFVPTMSPPPSLPSAQSTHSLSCFASSLLLLTSYDTFGFRAQLAITYYYSDCPLSFSLSIE